ncbi:hypothetical protein MIR68_011520 [Amoeboaphelidium protococcarum]|nr:hypothetical protein MIR68_011520 [Amoeboaphelidium protococcarum]
MAFGDGDLDSSLRKVAGEYQRTPVKYSVVTRQGAQTGEQVGKKRKLGDDEERKQARSAKLRAIAPKFISDFVDGQPVYTTVRVASEELIRQMEALDIEVLD